MITQPAYASLVRIAVKLYGRDTYHRFRTHIFERNIVNIFLPISFNIGFGCSKEPSYRDGSFEYPEHMFWLRNKKIYILYALLTKGLHIHI